MSLKQCEKCNEMVDEAKAFCPDCGHPFVQEQVRRELSEHDTFDGTLRLSQSSYNIMLSEMELDITEQPAAKIAPTPPPPAPAPVPVAAPEPGMSNLIRALIIIAIVIFLLAAAVVVAAVVIILLAQPK